MEVQARCNLGIFQTFVSLLMLALGVVPSILWGMAFDEWTLQRVFVFVYLISISVIGCVLLYAGVRLTSMRHHSSKVGELLIAIFNIIFIIIHLSTTIVLVYDLFRFSDFIIYCLMMMPSVALTILAFKSLIVGRKNQKPMDREK